jgi:hypothetical protein
MPGGRVLTRGRGSTGVPGQLVPVIWVFGSAAVRSAAMVMREFSIVWKLNFCIRARSMGQNQEICQCKKYVGSSMINIGR